MRKKFYLTILIFLLIAGNLFSAGVSFHRGKATLTPGSYATLDSLGDKLLKAFQENPNIIIKIFGYTDNKGAIRYNEKLSLERATAVRNYFIKKFNIPKERFLVKGMGPANPIASNSTKAGRAQNRRVEIKYKGKKLVLSSAPVAKPTAPEKPTAWVNWFRNKAMYRPKDKPTWVKSSANQSLYRLWKVNTLKNSFAGIKFKDESTFSMSPKTLIIIYGNIDDPQQKLKENKYHMELTTGNLLNKLKNLDSKKSFNIKTPASSLSLFSKENNVEVNKNEATLTSVYKGYVDTAALGKTVKVPEGYGNIVEKGKVPQAPVKLPNIPMNFQVRDNGYIAKGEPLNIKWDAVPNASLYEFQLSTDKNGQQSIIEKKVNANEITVPNLEIGKTYYYKIRSIDKVGLKSQFSPIQKVTVALKRLTQIDNANKNLIINANKTPYVVRGKTLGNSVFINGNMVKIGKKHNFSQPINLKPGKNEITIKTTSKDGGDEVVKYIVNFTLSQHSSSGASILIGLGYNFINGNWKNYVKQGISARFELNVYSAKSFLIPSVSLTGCRLLPKGEGVVFAAGAYSQLLPKSAFSPFLGLKLSLASWDSLPGEKANSTSFGFIPSFGLEYKINPHVSLRLQTDYYYNFNQFNSLGINLGVNFR